MNEGHEGLSLEKEWERYRKISADPVVVDKNANKWAYDDWDFDNHCPYPDAKPRSN